MAGCLSGGVVEDARPELLDHRYFYVEDKTKFGRCTCGIARDAIADFLRQHGANIFQTADWYEGLYRFKDNKSILGFLVQNIILSAIHKKGISIGDRTYSNMELRMYSEEIPIFELKKGPVLYVPYAYNFPAIDALILDFLDVEEKRL